MAYEILSNPEKRRLYDQAGEQGIKEGGGGGGGIMGMKSQHKTAKIQKAKDAE